jgi:thioredoxin reductase (NADPH)
MDGQQGSERYDAVIIGGGPAGLAAAIYLARACRSVAVFDCDQPGRSDWGQRNHNYLGFPEGVSIAELSERGRRQAERFGARFYHAEVANVVRDGEEFHVEAHGVALRGRALVLATGVTDRWVKFPGYEEFIGKSMHWCIVCDGYEMQGRRVVIAGNEDHAAEMALQMIHFTPEVGIVTNSEALAIPEELMRDLDEMGIPVSVGRIVGATAKEPGYFRSIMLHTGETLELDDLFNAQGATPNSQLARGLGVSLSDEGYIRVDTEAKTSVPGVYAAGDVTRLFSHQVITAAHEGATAATSVNYLIYTQDREAARGGGLARDESGQLVMEEIDRQA